MNSRHYVLAFGLLWLSACKKERTCVCTSSRHPERTTTLVYTHATRSQAEARCVSSTTQENGRTYETRCELK